MKKTLLTLLLIGCGSHKSGESVSFPAIEAKASFYCEQSKADYQEKKYVVSECDGAGFTSLYSLSCRENDVDLSVFQGANGEMFRNPAHDCYPTKSKAGYSKDHVLMRLVAAVGQGDKQWPRSFLSYVEKNNGVFCDAIDAQTKISRCVLSPFLYEYLSKASGRFSLPNENHSDDAWFEKEGFEAHLQVLGIWLKGKVDGSISDIDRNYLKAYAKREPENGLYQAMAYRYGVGSSQSVVAALSHPRWPSDRLPSSTDYCTPYLFDRDMKSRHDWDACPERNEIYSGTEYSFAYYVLSH